MTPKEAEAWLAKAMGIDPETPRQRVLLKRYRQFKKGLWFIGKNIFPEHCQYCDVSYHPMMRWVNNQSEMFFCCNSEDCQEKAKKAGFEPRPDITPRR